MKLTKNFRPELLRDSLDLDFNVAVNISVAIGQIEKEIMKDKGRFVRELIAPMKFAILENLKKKLEEVENLSEEEIYNQYKAEQNEN